MAGYPQVIVEAGFGTAAAAAPTVATGAFLDSAGMGAANITAAITLWEGWAGQPLKTIRDFSNGLSDFVFHTRYSDATAGGKTLCLDLKPAYNPVSPADLANLATLLDAMKAAGIKAKISLWHEPYYNGLSAAQYIAMAQYYAATVRSRYPLVFCTSESAVHNNSENSYYPGDAWVDEIATDWYCINWVNGHTLDLAASLADAAVPPKPFSLWETNALVNGGNFLTQPNSGFEPGSLGTWTNAGNCAVAVSSAQAHSGSWSMTMTSSAAGNMFAAHCTAANVLTQGLACSQDDVIAAGAWFRAATAGRTVQAGAQFYTSAGVLISSLFGGTSAADVTTGWTQEVAGTITAPATAAFCRLYIQVQAAGGAGEAHSVDDVLLANLSTGYTQPQVSGFFGYTGSFFAAREAAGLPSGDILLFNGAGANSTEITDGTDFRLPLFGALAGVPATAAATFVLGDPVYGILGGPGVLAAGGPVWVDITAWALGFTLARTSSRVQGPLLTYDAATAAVRLDNADGRFDPDNLSGPYVAGGVSQVRPMAPVRVRAIYGGTEYPLLAPFADSWQDPNEYQGGWGEVTLSATDGFKVLAGIGRVAQSPIGAGEDTGARVTRILNSAGWPLNDRAVATGDSTLQATTLDGDPLSELRLATDSEIGELYIDGAGRVVFRNRRAIVEDARSATVQAVFSDNPVDVSGELAYVSAGRAHDDTTLCNDVQITRVGGALQEATDPASVQTFLYPRTYSREGVLLLTDVDALACAHFVLYVSAGGENRFDTLTVSPEGDPDSEFPVCLGLQIGDRIQVIRRPPGVASPVVKDCFIRGITHTWDPLNEERTWETVFTLQSADRYSGFFVLGDPVRGVLGTSILGF